MKQILVLATLLAVATAGYAQIVIDNDNSDWYANPALLKTEPAGDRGAYQPLGGGDIVKWDVRTQGDGFIYAYVEDNNMALYFDNNPVEPPEDWAKDNCFAALLMDVDRVGVSTMYGNFGTRTGWDGPSMLGGDADNLSPELNWPIPAGSFGTHTIGLDIWCEYGEEGLNYWGPNDDSWNQGSTGKPGDQYDLVAPKWTATPRDPGANTTFIEFKYDIQRTKDELAGLLGYTYTDGIVPKKVWKCGMRLAGRDIDGQNRWDGDKTGNAADPSDPAAPKWVYFPVDTCMGDANEDQTVNLGDLSLLAASYGQTIAVGADGWAAGDFNADNSVNLTDLSIMAANYGQSCAPAAVPEPTVVVLLGLGVLGLLRKRS